MISPQRHSNSAASPRISAPLRGLFLDGIWRCNCIERPPAVKLLTKNHGINHGRWFYTCQRPQKDRCNFFLWASDAEAREKLTILSNSKTEAQTPTKTPHHDSTGLLTPQTDRPLRNAHSSAPRSFHSPPKSARARMMAEDTDDFGWDVSISGEVTPILDRPRQPDFGRPVDSQDGPRKTLRSDLFPSPGKRKLAEVESVPSPTPTSVFSPRSSMRGRVPPASAEISKTPTPSKYRDVVGGDTGGEMSELSELSLQALKILEGHGAVVPRKAQDALAELLNRYDLKTKGIIRGRDILRIVIKKKDVQIMELNERVALLESERGLRRSMNDELRGQ